MTPTRSMHWRSLCHVKMLAMLFLTSFATRTVSEDVHNITNLTPWNYDEVIGSEKHVFAMFHAPWCGACKKFMPKFESTAHFLKDQWKDLTIVKADITEFEYEELKENLNISHVPALKFFKKDSTDALFVHPREPWEMHFDVKEKMGLPIPNKCLFGDSDAADVSEADWEKTVMDDNTSVLVNFYAPWCPHCQKFVPVYNGIARKAVSIPGITVVRVNVDTEKALGKRYGVKTLPTLMHFPKTNKTGTRYKLPDTWSYLEMVNEILDVLQTPESTAAMELEAEALLDRVQVALAKDPPPGELEKGVLAVIDEHASLNITAVWKQSLQRLRTEIVEKVAFELKETALALAGEGRYKEALVILDRIQETYGDSAVAKSPAVDNLTHNCKVNGGNPKTDL